MSFPDEFGAITSIAVNDDVQYCEGGAETLRNTRSVTKVVAGLLIGIAIARRGAGAGQRGAHVSRRGLGRFRAAYAREHLFGPLGAVVAVTSANFGRRDAHELTERLLLEHILTTLSA